MAILGEMFTCPYDHRYFRQCSEALPDVGDLPPYRVDSTAEFLSKAAKGSGMYIIGGSVPERSGSSDKLYNTTLVFDNDGLLVGKYRKCHLFDVQIGASASNKGISFKESDTFAPGDLSPCIVQTPWGFDIGLGICFDVRFPEFALSLRKLSDRMKLLVYPSAFNMVTGPMHWGLLGRARALDTESFVVLASVSRCKEESFKVWGHSLVVSPYGDILQELDEAEGVLIQDIDISLVDRMRSEIPLMNLRRPDVYVP